MNDDPSGLTFIEISDLNERWQTKIKAAVENYCKFFNKRYIDDPKDYFSLAAFLNDPYTYDDNGISHRRLYVDITKPEIQEKVTMLAGPHWYAILKAMEAKKCP